MDSAGITNLRYSGRWLNMSLVFEYAALIRRKGQAHLRCYKISL